MRRKRDGRGGGCRPNNLASRCYTEMTDFSPPKTNFSLPLWMQFELILAWQSGSRGHGPMIFMPQMLYFLIFLLASLDI